MTGQMTAGTALIPAGMPVAGTSPGTGDGIDALWQRLARADWSSSAAAYATAADARQIIDRTRMTLGAFAAECSVRRIAGFGSQASVSRRLRWAGLHDGLWDAGILPPGVFLPESVTRPLFDGKLTPVRRLELLAELFGPHLDDEQKRRLAAELTQERMQEHLKARGAGPGQYRAPRVLHPQKTIARLLAQGMTAGEISEIARRLENSARNETPRSSPEGREQ